MARIFISYRRDEAGYVASMVRQHLEAEFGPGSVFMDIDNIPLGVDFRDHVSQAVAGCDVLLALMGETWAGHQADTSQRRIDNPQDFVRIEIESALQRSIPVVPVLIDQALMPPVQTLPESLRPLAYRNAAEVRAGRDLKTHLETLSDGLRAHLRSDQITQGNQPPALPPTPPKPAPSPADETGSRISKGAVAAGIAVLAAAGLGGWVFTRPADPGPTKDTEPRPQPPVTSVAPAPAPAPGPSLAASPAPPTTSAQPEPSVDRPSGAEELSALDGYKIAIFYLAGDTPAGQTARAIRDALAARGVTRGVELRLATEQKMRQLIPPEGLEVRYDEGREDAQAAALVKLLSSRPLRLTPTRKPVPADEPTPNFISVFVPKGG